MSHPYFWNGDQFWHLNKFATPTFFLGTIIRD